jgi:chromosome segregation ATPase
VAMPALKFEPEDPVEERTVMLEADVKHIRSDVSELKVDGRRLNDKVDGLSQQLVGKIDEADHRLGGKIDEVDQRLNAKIDGVEQRLSGKIDEVDRRLCGKIDSVKDSVASLALAMEKSFAELKIGRALDRVWWLLMSAALLGIMARAFKWI